MSPPLPGSDVIVPHCSSASALANTALRWRSHSGCARSGLANQNVITAGCIDETSATEASPPARRR
jgi:hypothetical protein